MKKTAKKVLGEILETGKSAGKQAKKQLSPKKMAKTAASQVTGVDFNKDKKEAISRSGLKGKGKLSSSEGQEIARLNKMRIEDAKTRDHGLSQTRAELERLKLKKVKKYKGIQKDIEKEHQKTEQQEEQKKQQEQREKTAEKQKKEEEKMQSVVLPQSENKTPGLKSRVKSKKGTREMGKKKLG